MIYAFFVSIVFICLIVVDAGRPTDREGERYSSFRRN